MSTAVQLDLERIAKAGRVSDQDVLAMRRAFFENGSIEARETSEIFRLGEMCEGESEAWPRFLVEATTDYIVYQVEPRGYVSDAQATWLIEHVSRDGKVATRTELELLVHILDTATEVPERLLEFTLESVKEAVLKGEGQLIGGASLEPGVIGKPEVDILRRVLYAAGGSSNIAISRTEAELLFDINDATNEAANHSAWSDLFVKAILNHLMAAHHFQPMSREKTLRISKWLDAPNAGVGGFFGKLFTNEMLSVKALYTAMTEPSANQKRLERIEHAVHAAEAVTGDEARWLAARMGRDGYLHENEKAILRFIRDECPDLHPGLESLMADI